MDDCMSLIFSKLDRKTLARMPRVSNQYFDCYRYTALKVCHENFKKYISKVNVPIENFENLDWLQGYFIKTDEGYSVIENDKIYPDDEYFSEDTKDDENKVISWKYPFDGTPPLDFFEGLIARPEAFQYCFEHVALGTTEGHMCLLTLQDNKNYFKNPQEWFPIYCPDETMIGVNIRTGEMGVVYYLEEDTFNCIIPNDMAFEIMILNYSKDKIGELLEKYLDCCLGLCYQSTSEECE